MPIMSEVAKKLAQVGGQRSVRSHLSMRTFSIALFGKAASPSHFT